MTLVILILGWFSFFNFTWLGIVLSIITILVAEAARKEKRGLSKIIIVLVEFFVILGLILRFL